jgi:hypothetical protein
MMSPIWNKYIEHYNTESVSFTLYTTGGCEPEFYVKEKRQLLIIIMIPTGVYNANQVFHQQWVGYGDHFNNRFYTNLQKTMDNQRNKAIQEMKTIPGNSIGGQVCNE